VASYTPSHKGQDVLFEVLADNKWKSRNLSITLCGKGLYEDYLKDLANFYALSNVTFGGQQPVDKIWEDHHALLLPSRKEGMSLALIEAMMMGRFGISTDVGGAREIIEDNVNGFIAKGPTAELLDEAMERAWARRNDWQNISEKAFHSIRQQIPINPSGYLADKIILSLKL
jgi:glycosyltransferase involved in cell wall biosynthesis